MEISEKDGTRPQFLIVGVVIPCHNHAESVQAAIVSAAEQDYPAKFIVVVDDGSSDDSYSKIVEMLESHKPEANGIFGPIKGYPVNMLVLKNEQPTGPSAARNLAIKTVWKKCHLFSMLDADDEYLPGKISKSVLPFLDNPDNIGVVYTDAIIRNNRKGTFVHEFRQPYSIDALRQECIISNTPMLSRLALGTCGLYDEGMRTAEDWDLWLRITQKFVAVHIAEPLHIYSVTGRNASDVVPREVWQANWAKIRQRWAQRDQ